MLWETVLSFRPRRRPGADGASRWPPATTGWTTSPGGRWRRSTGPAMLATAAAHHDGGGAGAPDRGRPAGRSAPSGSCFYFFETACALTGCLMGVNPFDQPGVERYKQNLFRLLGQTRLLIVFPNGKICATQNDTNTQKTGRNLL